LVNLCLLTYFNSYINFVSLHILFGPYVMMSPRGDVIYTSSIQFSCKNTLSSSNRLTDVNTNFLV